MTTPAKTQIDDGGWAFPQSETRAGNPMGNEFASAGGMTLRDYFAAKAMEGSRARNSLYTSWDDLAKDAYDIADAMLAVRNGGDDSDERPEPTNAERDAAAPGEEQHHL